MKDSKVYLKAAEICSEDSFMLAASACEEVSGEFDKFYDEFYFVFDDMPTLIGSNGAFVRSLALCFMAAIAKSEGR